MKRLTLYLCVCAVLLAGCSATAHLYPVQGPLAAQNPPPVFVAKMTDGLHSGNLSVVLNTGEVLRGRWEQVQRPAKPSSGAASAPSENMSAQWDLVYGQGFYTAHVLGARLYAKSELKGNQGTVLYAELYKPDKIQDQQNVASIKGVAKDDKGNIYKIAF